MYSTLALALLLQVQAYTPAPPTPPPPPKPHSILGIGSMPCSEFVHLPTEQQETALSWILGYLTAENFFNREKNGNGFKLGSEKRYYADARASCLTYPSQSLDWATRNITMFP